MEKLKFIVLLRTLEEEEVAAFRKYLKVVHGGEDIALRVFDYVRRFYPNFQDQKKLDTTYAYTKLFGALPEDKTKRKRALKNMLNAFSELHLWLKDFLLLQKIQNDDLDSQLLWLEILQERGLEAEYAKQATNLYTLTNEASQKDIKGYLRVFYASFHHYQHLALVRPVPNMGALQRCVDTIESCAEIIRLRMACFIATAKRLRPLKDPVQPSAPQFSSIQSVKEEPLLLLYRSIFHLISEEDQMYYEQIEGLLTAHVDQLHQDELHGVFGYLHNYAAMQIRNGNDAVFYKKAHELNKIALGRGIFNRKGIITPMQFTNVVSAACSAKDFDWATMFIKGYSFFLSDHIKQDTILLAQAIIHFEKKNFTRVLTLLQAAEIKDNFLVFRARLLVLRVYLERKEDIDAILTYCENFEAILFRSRKPKTGAVEGTLAFIRLARMLLLEKTDRQDLIDRIEKAPDLYYRAWLREQALLYKGRYVARKRRTRDLSS